jgi:hypothetical protein
VNNCLLAFTNITHTIHRDLFTLRLPKFQQVTCKSYRIKQYPNLLSAKALPILSFLNIPRGITPRDYAMADAPSAETIRITVGSPSAITVFDLPRYPLCTNVPVLSNMVTGYLKEGLPAELFFPQFKPSAFKIFTDWASTGTLPFLYTLEHKKDDPSDCWNWNPYRAYNIGEWFMLPELMDAVMDRLVVAFRERQEKERVLRHPRICTPAPSVVNAKSNVTSRNDAQIASRPESNAFIRYLLGRGVAWATLGCAP